MALDAREDTAYMKQMLDNAEENVDSLTKKLSLVIEMVEDADDLGKLKKVVRRIKSDMIMSGVKL
jgi:site-specific recombinase